MAFDHADTDELYERSIAPVLRSLGIVPVIINQHQSNDDLNHQIIQQLDECDLCIADLTYTRPSVYFEAGYAERLVPVIYTVRDDHLRRSQPDDARVHFDLQMKPLIRWSAGAETAFQTRLKRRIEATFLTSWRRAAAQDEQLAAARHSFSAQSLLARTVESRRILFTEYARAGLKEWEPFLRPGKPTSDLVQLARPSGPLYSTAKRPRSQRLALAFATDSATQQTFREIMEMAPYTGLFGHASQGMNGKLPVEVSIICVSVNAVPASRFAKWFPTFSPTDIPSRLSKTDVDEGIPTARRTVEFISPVRSGVELTKAVREAVSAAFALEQPGR